MLVSEILAKHARKKDNNDDDKGENSTRFRCEMLRIVRGEVAWASFVHVQLSTTCS